MGETNSGDSRHERYCRYPQNEGGISLLFVPFERSSMADSALPKQLPTATLNTLVCLYYELESTCHFRSHVSMFSSFCSRSHFRSHIFQFPFPFPFPFSHFSVFSSCPRKCGTACKYQTPMLACLHGCLYICLETHVLKLLKESKIVACMWCCKLPTERMVV